jgi:hypothetical protein
MDREENRREDSEALVAAGLAVHATDVVSVATLADQLAGLAAACAVEAPPIEVGAPVAPRIRAFTAIWRRPWMSIGADTYGSSLLDHLGVGNVFADSAQRYPTVELADVGARAPDVVLLPSEPYPFAERHLAELRAALGEVEVHLVDGRDLFWWGVRTPGALLRLGAQLC